MFIFIGAVIAPLESRATHAAGAELTYTHISGYDYRISAVFYRDCGGVAEPNSLIIKFRSDSLGFTSTAVAFKDTLSGQEITVPCSSAVTTCNGGGVTGIRRFVYVATITLPQNAPDWIFSYYVCCRNCAITTITTPCAPNSLIYVEAGLNSSSAPANNSPVFSQMPVVFICVGQNFNYNNNVVDIDGDSLAYELITPRINDSTFVNYISPNSFSSPVQSSTPFTLNPYTGDLNFTPSQQQIGIFAFRVKEFRNGVQIGSVSRDMQVYTVTCMNSLPVLSGVNNTTAFIFNACVGASSCFSVQSFDNDSLQNLSFSTDVQQNIPGASLVVSTGQRPSLNFCWTPSISHKRTAPYVFHVTVKDNACPGNGFQTFTYEVYVSGTDVTLATTPAACSGTSGGTASVVCQAGCTFLWSTTPPQTTATATNLLAGNYSVTVTDPSGCVSVHPVVVPQANMIAINGIVNPLNCSAPNSGSINVSVNGGVAPYAFIWSNGQTSRDIDSLVAGTYTVTVTDNSGCYQYATFTILGALSPLTSSATVNQQVICDSASVSSILVSVSGGVSPYTYLWNNGSTLPQMTTSVGGVYHCVITDANGCTSTTLSDTIFRSLVALSINGTVAPVTCSAQNSGSIDLGVVGGFSPYSYSWSNGSTSQDVGLLNTGAYTVLVTDHKGCTQSATFVVNGSASTMALSAMVKDVNCYGDSTGEVSVMVSGGAFPYQYLWSTGTVLPTLKNLKQGNYNVTVTDNNGCVKDSVFTILQPGSALTTNVVLNQPACNAQGITFATVNASGGSPPYNYQWSNGSTLSQISNLSPGTYSVTVNDMKGCSITGSVIVSAGATAMGLTVNVTDADCLHGKQGSLIVNVNGGLPPYSFLWSNGITTAQVSSASGGNYTVTVTDANGCTSLIEQPVADHSQLSVTAEGPVEFCVGGLVTLSTSPVPGVNYQWYQNGHLLGGATHPSFTTPATGAYTLAATTACGTFVSNPLNVRVNSLSNYFVSPNMIICSSKGESTTLVANGGSHYQWSPGLGLSDSTISSPIARPLQTTKYAVFITSAEGCSERGEVTVTVICDSLDVPNAFTPDGNNINDVFVIKGIEQYPGNNLYIYNRWGNLVYKKKNYSNNWNGNSNVSGPALGSQLPDGTYFYILDLNDGKKPVQGFITLKR